MKIFLVQHTKTGAFLPTDFAKGGTYWDGQTGKAPRTFHSRMAAQAFINHWVKGQAYIWTETSPDSFYGTEIVGLEYRNMDRKSSDIRIREATIVLAPIQQELDLDA